MPQTNSWLCQYAIAQLGKPYLMGSSGQIQTSTQSELKQYNFFDSDWHANPNYNKEVKHHDCSGLIVGALTCDSVTDGPVRESPVFHGSNSQYLYYCRTKSSSMSNFPYIPGTLVFHTNYEDVRAHVGIYIGTFTDIDGNEHNDAVVEAKGRDWGVLISDIGAYKWDCWGQLDCCTVDTKKGMKFDARTLGISGGAVKINTEAMRPFVATLSPSYSQKLDYAKIKDARISAMMFFGGELYDESHIRKTYINPNLAKQVQQCNDVGLPWALYVNVRAKNMIEADAECRALYYIISRYSPTLGLWLSLQMHNQTEINNDILDVYYKYIDNWGLRARCGLYVTPSQLSRISWNKYQDRFYLWMIDKMPVADIDDELLQPEMFEVPD